MAMTATSLGGSNASGTNAISLTISGGSAGRVVLVPAWETNAGGTLTITSVSGASGTWTRRSRNAVGVYDQVVEVWYADFASSPSGTVTVNLSGSFDDACLLAMLVTTNVAGPIAWDANGSLPATPAIGVGTAAVSTLATAPFVVLAGGKPDNVFWSSPVPSGVANVLTHSTSGGTQHQFTTLDAGTTAHLASTTAGYTAGAGDNFGCVCIDALTDVPAPTNQGNMLAVL